MPSQIPDTKLRRMIVDLAALHVEDVAEILAELDPAQRLTVEGLLREYASPLEAEVQVPVPTDCDTSRLSAWLVRRWAPASSKDDFRIAHHTRKTLHDCAAKLYPAHSGRSSSGEMMP